MFTIINFRFLNSHIEPGKRYDYMLEIPFKIDKIKQDNSVTLTLESAVKTPVYLDTLYLIPTYIKHIKERAQKMKMFCPITELYSDQTIKLGSCPIPE